MRVGEFTDELVFFFISIVIDGTLVPYDDFESHLPNLGFEAFANGKVQGAVVKHILGPFPHCVQFGMDVARDVWPSVAVEVLNSVWGCLIRHVDIDDLVCHLVSV